jgi:hypothetical protein
MSIKLNPGQAIRRKILHEQYGGRVQGGIAPSAKTSAIMIFTSPAGLEFGYHDRVMPDRTLHYVGEGQRGDQTMSNGNKSILLHNSPEKQKELHVFNGARGEVIYVGRYALSESTPYYMTDAPDIDGDIRQVITFVLTPMGLVKDQKLRKDKEGLVSPGGSANVTKVPPEDSQKEQFNTPKTPDSTSVRREAMLVRDYQTWRESQGLTSLERLKIMPVGEASPLYTDLYDDTCSPEILIEAKSSATREAVRMAIGQLLDYARFTGERTLKKVLLPTKPRPDIKALLASQNIGIIYKVASGFIDEPADQK